MALVWRSEAAPRPAPLPAPCSAHYSLVDYSITQVPYELRDLSWTSADGSELGDKKLENEVMVDTWSSMDSSNSPLTDSGPSASDDCTPSTSSDPPRSSLNPFLPKEPDRPKAKIVKPVDKSRARNLTLDLDSLEPESSLPRRPHFLDEDYQPPSKSNLECRIPKPHFLDHIPSPDELDERSDLNNPNFLEDEIDGDDKKTGALAKKPPKPTTPSQERPRTNYRSTLHYGLESAARSSERDKRASQLYNRGTWPGEREWTGQDAASVRSFSSNGSADGQRPSSNIESKMECVYSLLSLLTLSPDNNADLSGSLLEMSRNVDSCIAMRQAGCIPLLVQLIHSKLPRETRDRAAKALRNIIHTQTDDKAGRREARVWRLLEQVREYCYLLEDVVEGNKEDKSGVEDDATKHPSQSVAALMKLSFDEEHRHVVCQLGGLQALAALVSGDQAAHGSRTDDNTCLTMRKYAGMTLTNLTFGDGNNKSLLCSFKNFMMALVEQLESPNEDMRQVTAAVLRNLSWRADTNSKQVLREVGAVKGLTKAAMSCQKEATLKSVLSALWNLTAHCSMNKVALCSVDGALGFLVDMLSYNSPTKTLAIIENAGGIMRNVSSHIAVREDYREILRERNCLSVLLQHLKSPSLTVVSNSCGTLWNLSARCPLDQQFLWDHGAVPMLRSLIHSKHKMIAMGSSAALKNLLNSKPGKTHIISLDSTARSMNLPALPTLNARKQKALEQELDQNLAETCDNIEPATSPSTSNREEKNLFTATMNLERHRMTSSSPLMGTLASQISLSHSANLAGYLSCSNTLLKGVLARSDSSTTKVNRSDSKDSVTSAQSDTAVERVMRTGKVPVPTPRNKDLMKTETTDAKTEPKNFRYPQQPPIPPPRNTEMRTNYTESGYDVDQDSCDQPIDYSTKYSETKTEAVVEAIPKKPSKKSKKEFGDYQETDLDQPTDYSLRYAEHHSETGSDASDPPGPSVDEDTIQHFATEGTPYETPIIFSTATSMSDLRVIGRDGKPKSAPAAKEHPERMARSDEKDSIDRPDNDKAVKPPVPEKRGVFDTKFSSGMISPEKPVNYCEEGTPGYFSRVSSLSSLGEPTEEDCLAKRNAMATIHVDPAEDLDCGGVKDKEGSKAVTFAATSASTPPTPSPPPLTPGTGLTTPGCVQDTPLMFSRTSSLSSLPAGETQDVQSLHSEVSRLTSGCISPSEIPDSPTQSVPASPARAPPSPPPPPPAEESAEPRSVFEERATTFLVENTPAHFSTATSLSSLTIDDEHNKMLSEIISEEHAPGDADVSTESARYGERDDRIPGEYRAASPRDLDQPAEGAPGGGSVGSASDLSALSIPDDNYDARLQSLLPGYLRASTETVKMTQDYGRTVRDRAPLSPPPPPLPPKTLGVPRRPPPAPPVDAGGAPPPPLPRAPRRDSLSSLSLDSFGSTDREIFEETVQAGLCSVAPRARDEGRGKAHSVERPADPVRPHRQHKSLDRSEKITRLPAERRPPRARHDPRPRAHRDGPPGLDLSNSLSSLSNDSFGSTDKEVFERCVRVGMATGPEGRLRARSTDRLEPRDSNRSRRRRSEQGRGALDRMVGEDSRDRALLEEVIARGAGERGPPKNVQAPSLGAHEDGSEGHARIDLQTTGYSDTAPQTIGCSDTAPHTTGCSDTAPQVTGYSDTAPHTTGYSDTAPQTTGYSDTAPQTTGYSDTAPHTTGCSDTAPHTTGYSDTAPQTTGYSDTAPQTTGYSDTAPHTTGCSDTAPQTTGYSDTFDATEPDTRGSNECLANRSGNTTLDSAKDELDRSNESYAAVLDGSWSDGDAPADRGTLTRKQHDWTDGTDRRADTWDDNTCPDDVTFPTLSGSVHLAASVRSEVDPAGALPDLVERIDAANRTPSRPDLTHRLGPDPPDLSCNMSCNMSGDKLLDSVPEPSFASLADDGENFDSIMSAAIEREAARLAAQLRLSQCTMVDSATSLTSLDLDNVKPPSHLGSLLSLSTSGHWEESSQMSKKSKGRKKSIPVTMVKRALSNSMHQGSSEHLDSSPVSFLDNVKPPAEMEHIDMEGSMISVSSIASEVAEGKEKPALVFDFKQPVHDFPICNALSTVYHDLDKVNPPSLFDEMVESTLEIEQTTAHEMFDDCLSTLNVVTDIPSGSENCTPIPSDVSSVESTPKRRNAKYLTPKEKRQIARDRFQTYTIADTLTENASVLEDDSEYLTWTKSESDSRSDDYATAASEPKSKRKSAKQRRIDDRARYLTQTVDLNTILQNGAEKTVDPQIESLRQRLAAKRTVKQKRQEDADRFRTRTLSDDIPPSPTFVCKDINFETVESTTGYDSLSSNEPSHQQLLDDRHSDACSRDADSGNNEDDFELNSTKMQTYTRSFRHYLPVTESPAAVDMCVAKNLKNIEMTASYRRLQDGKHHPSSGDFASYEGESNSEEKAQTDSEPDTPPCRPKPKITKPGPGTRDESLDSDSQEKDEVFKAVRGRKKALYVSPYRRSVPSAKQSISPVIKPAPKALVPTPNKFAVKTPNRTPSTSKTSSATTSPKKLQKPATKLQKTPLSAIRPLPLERQGTFTKEESSVPPKDLPVLGKTPGRAAPPAPLASTSPSRLPQPGRFTRPPLRKVSSTESKLLPKKTGTVRSAPAMRSSASNQSLQSNDSGKTVTLAARSRPGSSSSVSSTPPAKLHTKDIESKIAGLWKKVEQNKKVPTKPDRRVWIEPEEPPRLLRSNTFEGKPQEQVTVAPKQKTSIGLRVTQIPSLKAKTNVTAKPSQLPSKRPANAKVFAKKPVYGQT